MKDVTDDLDMLLDEVDTDHNRGSDFSDDHAHHDSHIGVHDDDDDFFEQGSQSSVRASTSRSNIDDEEEEEEDEVPPLKSAKDIDESEEEEDDSEVVAKKGPSKLIVGAACVVGILGLAGGYVKFFRGADSESQPMVHTSMPAPSIDDLGKDLSIPSTNLVDDDVSSALDGSPATDQGKKPVVAKAPALGGLASAVAEGNVHSAPVVSSPPVVATQAPVDVHPVSAPVVAVEPPVVAAVTDGAVLSVPPVNTVVPSQPSTTAAIPVVSSTEMSGSSSADDSISKDDVKKMVEEAMHESGAADIKKQLASIQDALKAGPQGASGSHSVEKQRILDEIKQEEDQKAKLAKEASDKLVADATQGKQRLPGFKVINVSKDGTISIITSPSGRTFALFKGETFRAANGVSLKVKEILADGKFVVAGDSWFIDETLVDVPKGVVKTKASPEKSSAPEASEKPVVKKQKESSLGGWSLTATFEGGGYLVVSPSGEYKTVTKGTSDSVLGEIVGVDDQGNLKTTKGVIKGNLQ
jgi:hypothetical protein